MRARGAGDDRADLDVRDVLGDVACRDGRKVRCDDEDMGAGVKISDVQAEVWANKIRQGFNVTDVPTEFCLTMAELGEAFDAWRKSPATLGEELADVVLFVAGLAEMNGIDLQEQVVRKLERNRGRTYRQGPNGLKVQA